MIKSATYRESIDNGKVVHKVIEIELVQKCFRQTDIEKLGQVLLVVSYNEKI